MRKPKVSAKPRHKYFVAYSILSGATGQVVSHGSYETFAEDAPAAGRRCADWVQQNDGHHDSRIDPRIRIDSVEEVEN